MLVLVYLFLHGTISVVFVGLVLGPRVSCYRLDKISALFFATKVEHDFTFGDKNGRKGPMGKMWQRAGVLVELPGVLRDLGVDPSAVFAGTGIDPASLSTEARIPFPPLLKLLDRAARQAACPHLGLLVGLRFKFAMHGVIGQLMLTAPNLGQALLDLLSWHPGYSSGAIVYLNQYDQEYAFGYGSFAASMPGSQVLYDVVISVATRMVHDLTNGAVKPVEVQYSHRAPETASAYERLLNLPVQFNQNRSCLILNAEALRTPLPGYDAQTRKRILADIERTVFEAPMDVSTHVRRELRQALCLDKPSLPRVASLMGVHPRTLERQLADEGQTFRALREQVCFAVARELLELTDIPVSEISAILGFSAPSVLSTMFRRITGKTPSACRAAVPR
jgi:AraC-like DNA-binding protein